MFKRTGVFHTALSAGCRYIIILNGGGGGKKKKRKLSIMAHPLTPSSASLVGLFNKNVVGAGTSLGRARLATLRGSYSELGRRLPASSSGLMQLKVFAVNSIFRLMFSCNLLRSHPSGKHISLCNDNGNVSFFRRTLTARAHTSYGTWSARPFRPTPTQRLLSPNNFVRIACGLLPNSNRHTVRVNFWLIPPFDSTRYYCFSTITLCRRVLFHFLALFQNEYASRILVLQIHSGRPTHRINAYVWKSCRRV